MAISARKSQWQSLSFIRLRSVLKMIKWSVQVDIWVHYIIKLKRETEKKIIKTTHILKGSALKEWCTQTIHTHTPRPIILNQKFNKLFHLIYCRNVLCFWNNIFVVHYSSSLFFIFFLYVCWVKPYNCELNET